MSMVLDGDYRRSRMTDPETSVEAGRKVEESAKTVRQRVLQIFEERVMLTDDDLTHHYFQKFTDKPLHVDSPRKRRSELTADGVIVEVKNVVKKSRSGVHQQVWRLK